MRKRRRDGTRSAVLALSVALGGEWTVHAQRPSLSTGSGVGTGAGAGAMSSADTGAGGAMTGTERSGSGMMSGRGPGAPMQFDRSGPLGPRGSGTVTYGPGVDVSFPTDPFLVPFLVPQEVDNALEGPAVGRVGTTVLADARRITDPAERSLALRQIANGAIASNQLVLAHNTLEESITASSHVTVPLVRDQRLIGLVMSLTALSEALLRVASENRGMIAPADEAQLAGLDPVVRHSEPAVMIRMARLEWRRAVYLASIISNPTYRNEMLYQVAKDEAVGSSRVANDLPRGSLDINSLGNRRPSEMARDAARPGAPNPPSAQPPPGPAPIRPAPSAPRDATPSPLPGPDRRDQDPDDDNDDTYTRVADEILVDSWNVARKADRLIWKNRAMVYISLEASNSRQYTRGVELARTIENAESRSEALLLLAEAQCRGSLKTAIDMVDFLAGYLGGAAIKEMRRADWPTVEYETLSSVATSTYQAAAEAVASIPQDGLRGVMVGFLIDSLIASGRFDDARSCTAIYPEESERFVALGAIAEAQGRRGLADSARRWIATEVPEAYRSALYRRVVTGVLWSVENERSKEQPGGPAADVPPVTR